MRLPVHLSKSNEGRGVAPVLPCNEKRMEAQAWGGRSMHQKTTTPRNAVCASGGMCMA